MQISQTGVQPSLPVHSEEKLKELAVKLEATFLSEMLKSAGLNGSEDGFASGVGETQFASFLTQERATALASSGGIGLAERIFESLSAQAGGRINE